MLEGSGFRKLTVNGTKAALKKFLKPAIVRTALYIGKAVGAKTGSLQVSLQPILWNQTVEERFWALRTCMVMD